MPALPSCSQSSSFSWLLLLLLLLASMSSHFILIAYCAPAAATVIYCYCMLATFILPCIESRDQIAWEGKKAGWGGEKGVNFCSFRDLFAYLVILWHPFFILILFLLFSTFWFFASFWVFQSPVYNIAQKTELIHRVALILYRYFASLKALERNTKQAKYLLIFFLSTKKDLISKVDIGPPWKNASFLQVAHGIHNKKKSGKDKAEGRERASERGRERKLFLFVQWAERFGCHL